MSIIIAKKMDGVTIILSDTKLSIDSPDKSTTGGHKLRIAPEKGALKSIIIFNGICISYAGDVSAACSIILEFQKIRFSSIEEMSMYLQKKIVDYGDDVEFILACANKQDQFLFKITKQEVSISSDSVWIGSYSAFNRFQYIYKSEQEKSTELQRAFKNGFQKLLEEQSIPEIGDFMVETVFNPKNGACFFYSDSLISHRGLTSISIKANEVLTLDDGSAEIGSYTISTLVSKHCKNPALLHYFNHGNFGILYMPDEVLKNEGRGVVVKDLPPESVFLQMKDQYGLELIGPYFLDGKFYFHNK